MFSPRWRKVLRDLWGNKTRTILVVLSIAVGVFAIGMIMSTNESIGRDLPLAYDRINPAYAEIFVEPFDIDLVPIVEEVEGVTDVFARREFGVTHIQSPDREESLRITFFPDFENIAVNKIFPIEGAWPPPPNTIIVERSALDFMGVEIGDTILIETRAGRQRELEISGVAHDINIDPVAFNPPGIAYANFEMLDYLGEDRLFDELLIRVENNGTEAHPSEEYVKSVADAVRNKIEKGGREVYWIWMPTPGEHPATQPVNAILAILGILGGFSLFLSGFLVVNIINSLLAQHVRQIGIMKSVGARTDQIFSMYLITVIVFGLLSLFIAVPLGAVAGFFLAGYLANLVNFDIAGFGFSPTVVLIQIGVGVGVPILASLWPVIKGARVSVREAISEQGLGKGQFGTHFVDRWMSWVTGTLMRLTRPMALSLRNTIRRKARLYLTLFTMILGGAVFISVVSVYDSLLATMEDALDYFSYDVSLDFNRAFRIEEIDAIAQTVDGVQATESWIGESVRRVRDNDTEGENLVILGVPSDTQVINPVIVEGRWIRPDDQNVLVITSEVLSREEGIELGDWLTLKVEGEEQEWLVVGIARTVMIGPLMYANQDYLGRTVGRLGKSSGVQIVGSSSTPEAQSALSEELVKAYEAAGLEVTSSETLSEIREQIISQFQIIVVLLAVMAILIALVGGLGLMGTMSINVLERTREIGVIRAVGASDRSVLRVVLVEGFFIGLISWVLAALIAYPLGQWLSNLVGENLLESPLTYVYSFRGAGWWIAAVLLIAGLASFLPARSASSMSVRETLAYE